MVTTYTVVALFIIGTGIGVGGLALILIAIDDAKDAIVDAIKRGPDPVVVRNAQVDLTELEALHNTSKVAAAYHERRKYDGRL